MSGGAFDYQQYVLNDIAEAIEHRAKNVGGDEFVHDPYPPDVIHAFLKAASLLRIAAVYVQRIDWLVSGDDGVETFRTRLAEEIAQLNLNHRGWSL